MPGTSRDYLRPAVPVVIEGLPRAPQVCLLDTGALHNRFGGWVARAAGISLGDATEEIVTLGGFRARALTLPVQLTIGGTTWEAPVSFCDPWPLGFHLLGQEGFFRWFKVTIRAARFTVDITTDESNHGA